MYTVQKKYTIYVMTIIFFFQLKQYIYLPSVQVRRRNTISKSYK